MTGFGECVACGCGVERAGWDDLCFRCQEAEKAEFADDEDADWIAEENRRLYSIGHLMSPASEGE